MRELKFEERVKGCLVGSVIGAELGFARIVHPERFNISNPGDIFGLKLEPTGEYQEEKGRIDYRKVTPFIDLGIRAYLIKKGRVTPEDFAQLLKNDSHLSGPVFGWDSIHTNQELLKEGMNPRLSGLCTAPNGHTCAFMPAVGIYHFNDPEYAYLDGVELASVTQPRIGADWAGLCAAAIASAFDPDSTPETVTDAVLKIAHENNKELFYQTNFVFRTVPRNEDEFLNWWYCSGGKADAHKETNWFAYNPVSFVLPLLRCFGSDAKKIMALIAGAQNNDSVIYAPIAGAILGALYGLEIFPKEWREWAEPAATPWYKIIDVVSKRVEEEKKIIATIEQLKKEKAGSNSLLFEKIYGCVLAGAIGNAMGSPVERAFYWEIDKRFPGGITTVLEPKRLESEDDNQMAMLLLKTYLERDGLPVMARHFGKTWKEKLNRDHFYPYCMGNSYDLICRGWDPRITGHWNVVTGSTVMCMEPVGIYNITDSEFAIIDATAVSYMYQRGLDVTAAAILVAAVAEALKPEATVESVCNAALSTAPKEKFKTFDNRKFNSPYNYLKACLEIADKYSDVMAARGELYEKCLLYHHIDPIELLGFALAMFKIAKGDVRQAAIGGTNIGRDSDTIAGRAAMLSGALKGAKSVPEEWIKLFKPEILEKIKRNVELMCDVIVEKKLSRLQCRQQEINCNQRNIFSEKF